MKFLSKQHLDEQKQEYSLLPAEDYKLQIVKIEEDTQNKYQSDETEDIIKVQFEVVSYKDGEEAFDVEGKPAKGRRVFFTGRPDSMGFQQDGTPSKTRALVAYATGQDILEEINLESWEQLLGQNIDAEIIQKQNTKGVMQNRIARFIAPKGKRPAQKMSKEGIPIIEEEPTIEDINEDLQG